MASVVLAFLGLVLGVADSFAQAPAFTEYQVKALFLLNFAKYVEWPAEAFADATTPIAIGVVGEDPFDGRLEKAVMGKSVGGRAIVIRKVSNDDDLPKCHILYISILEKKRLAAVLAKVKATPVLTVGESEHFAQEGGVISFVKKDEKIRLEIDLNAARQARLQLSSKLLSVADVVRGKP
jgi:hypothetical protein